MAGLRSIAGITDASASDLFLRLFVLTTSLGVLYSIWTIIYNLFFHPLRHHPGPKLWAISGIPYALNYVSGDGHVHMLNLHKKYGPVVRVAPSDLAYNHPDAWREIMGHRKQNEAEHGKDPRFVADAVQSIISAPRDVHSRIRRALSHGFSAQAMLEDQQPIIKEYVDLLFTRLREHSEAGRPLDMAAWYNWATFDIIGDLAFGEPFDCLRDARWHPWVRSLFDGVKGLAQMAVVRRFPTVNSILMRLVPAENRRMREEHKALSAEKVGRRLANVGIRHDFIEALAGRKGDSGVSRPEINATASTLVIAGSETTATTLAAATYYLGTNPRVLEKLSHEVRTNFSSEDEIDMLSVQKLSYMLAVLNETLRCFPAVPSGMPRQIAPEGEVVLGKFVPGGTVVTVWHWPMYHNPANFALPDSFVPERWIDNGDARFAKDKKDAFQPFGFGPRNCIGRNLAYTEMRLILARLIWNFDLRLDESSLTFENDSKMYFLWEKGAVNVFLTPRSRDSLMQGPNVDVGVLVESGAL